MVEVHPFEGAHRPALLALMREAFEGHDDEDFFEGLIAGSERIWLAADGEEAAGFCRVVPDEETLARRRACMDILHIGQMAPEQGGPEEALARRETGGALIETVRGYARENGLDGVWGYFTEPLGRDLVEATRGVLLREIRLLRLDLDGEFPAPELPEGYRLRPLNPQKDLNLASEIYNDTFSEMWNFRPHSTEDIAHWFESADTAPGDCFILEYEGGGLSREAGMAILSIDGDRVAGGDPTCYVPDIGVAGGHRRRGLGGALMAAVIERARAQELSALELIADDADPAAKAFYKSLGFDEMGKITVYEW
jgi:ribosomal protein S18 acetylase RimI-like enzyme